MGAFDIVFLCFFLLMAVLIVVGVIMKKREVRDMTLSRFKEKVNFYVKKRDGSGLSSFVRRHLVFVLTHGEELKPFIEKISGGTTSDFETEKEVKKDIDGDC